MSVFYRLLRRLPLSLNAQPDVLRKKAPGFEFSDSEWTGEDWNLGLGVFSFSGLTLRRHQTWKKEYHLFIPVEIRGFLSANLLAVWAFNHRVPRTITNAPSTTAEIISYYSAFLQLSPNPMVAGDFNSNVFWDKKGYPPFSAVNEALRNAGVVSAYHSLKQLPLGDEPDNTLFFRKKADAGYHIDYIYVPEAWLKRDQLESIVIGQAGEWLSSSDHAPITVRANLN